MQTKERIVLKYGGTSVGTGARLCHVSSIIKQITSETMQQPILVVSAMSGTLKSQGTTQLLLEAVEEILKPNSQKYFEIVNGIESNHLKACREAIINNPAQLEALETQVRSECTRLRSFMSAAELIDEISPKTRDAIVGMGERLSAILLTHVLKAEGLNSKFITLDKLITKKFDASSLDQQFYDYIVSRLAQEVVPYVESHVCVITGFFGPCPGSLLSSVGRGYTDLTAALVAVAAQAKEYQIWKEVDGIFTADPRKVPDAKKLDYITPEEAAELTYYGSEVVHPFTMEQVIRANIPIRIKNTFNPAGTGTLITREVMSPQIGDDRSPTAVTIKDNVTVLNISSNRKSVSHGFLAKTFLVLDQFGIVVDLISTSEVHVSMALGVGLSAEVLEKAVIELEKTGRVDVVKNMAILSLVGKKMRNTVGISARMFSCLASHEVNLEMISQGASEINVSCVIKNSEALKAVNCVHHALILQKQ